MKRLLVCTGLLAAGMFAVAQAKPPASPPETATGTIGGHTITISYNSPGVKGREGKVFGSDGLIKNAHGSQYPIWRAGANAATTLTTDTSLKIGNIDVPAGKYTLFVDITDESQWVLIVNKKTGEWGLAYDASQDVGKTKMEMGKPSSMVEQLKYTITSDGGNKGKLTLAWENREVSVPIEVQ